MLANCAKAALIAILLMPRQGAAQAQTKVFVPTSTAIDIARTVAMNLGYPLGDKQRYYFDVLSGRDGAPLYPGYVTVEFVWDGAHVSSVSINEQTLQTLDMTACLVFDYPDMKPDQAAMSRRTGVKPLALARLRDESDCGDRLQVRSRATHR